MVIRLPLQAFVCPDHFSPRRSIFGKEKIGQGGPLFTPDQLSRDRSLFSRGGPYPTGKMGTGGPHITGIMGTGVPILPGLWGRGSLF